MKWPRNVRNICYSMQLSEEIVNKIRQQDRNGYTLQEKLEHVQGTVQMHYWNSNVPEIFITVTRLSDTKEYWLKIATAIELHIEEV